LEEKPTHVSFGFGGTGVHFMDPKKRREDVEIVLVADAHSGGRSGLDPRGMRK